MTEGTHILYKHPHIRAHVYTHTHTHTHTHTIDTRSLAKSPLIQLDSLPSCIKEPGGNT